MPIARRVASNGVRAHLALCDFALSVRTGTLVSGSLGTYPPFEGWGGEGDPEGLVFISSMQSSADAWAFGLFLYLLLYHRRFLPYFSFDRDWSVILRARDSLVDSLAPRGEKLQDDLIRSLLSLDPFARPPMGRVVSVLDELLGSVDPESMRGRKELFPTEEGIIAAQIHHLLDPGQQGAMEGVRQALLSCFSQTLPIECDSP